MKQLKHLLTAALTLLMALAIATPALAGTITINRDQKYDGSNGRTYTAYKVFDADTSLSGDDKGTNTQADPKTITYGADGPIAYTMATNSPWVDKFFNTAGEQILATDYFTIQLAADGSKYIVTPAKETFTAEDAEAIATLLNTNLPTGLTGTTITPGTAATVDDGYYLIVASDGATNLTLVTADVEIIEKNSYITTKKETEETSYSVGDTIEYTAEVFIPADTKVGDPVILHDEMNAVLAFNEDVEATMDGAAFTAFSTSYDEGAEALTDDCTFEIYIPVTTSLLGKTITFTYSAELTSAAINPDTGFINKLFGEKNGYKTTPDQPEVYTFDFDMVKIFDEDDETLTAKFVLIPGDADEYIATGDDANAIALKAVTGGYVKADSDDTDTITEFEVTNGVPVNFQGFAAGSYKLVELETSTGYNLLTAPVTITITDTSDDTSYKHDVTPTNALGQVEVENHQGTVLPSTGGIGTTIFYVVGGALVITAGVLLVTKRRMASLEK